MGKLPLQDDKKGAVMGGTDGAFFDDVARIIERARSYIGRAVDLTMCVTYFEVGRMIVEEEQGGRARLVERIVWLPQRKVWQGIFCS